LDRRQQIVVENEAAIRSALNVPSPEELWIRLSFDEDGWKFYEAVRNVRIVLHVQEPASDEDTRSTIRSR